MTHHSTAERKRTHIGLLPEQLVAPVPMSEDQRRTVFMAASLLLDYPDAGFSERLAAVSDALGALAPPTAERFAAFVAAARARGTRALEEHYVETFDQRRRCSLFLSYYTVGDTRDRGQAILAFSHIITELGFEQDREELPDHLAVVLQAAAQASPEGHRYATELLAAHRDGIEVLRAALEGLESPYADLTVAVCQALPPADEEVAARFTQLIRSGPPAELVGAGSPLPFPTAHLADGRR